MSNEGRLAMHPAWQCAHRKLTNLDRWNAYEAGRDGGYYDSQIALAMIVGGFGHDVVVTYRDDEGNPGGYAFPDRWVLVDEEAGRRIGPHPRLLREVHGDKSTDEVIGRFFPVSTRQYALNGRG